MKTNFRGAFAGLVRGIPVTVALILANVAVYLAMSAIDKRAGDADGQAAYLTQWGANVGGLTFTGEPWRLVTSLFVHAGGLHLLLNCLALLEIGGVVERRVKGWRTLAIYLLAGLGGSYASARWSGFTVSVGASGAVFGLLGALIVFGYLARNRRLRGPYGEAVSPGRALLLGAATLALGLFFNVDNAAHLGGFVCGAALSVVALLAERARRARTRALVFATAVLAAGAALAWRAASAFDAELAQRVRFAQLMATVRDGNAGARITLRRCALAAADARDGAAPAAFVACLGQASRYAPLLEHNRLAVWPRCQQRAQRLLRQSTLPDTRRALVVAVARHCAGRALIEGAALPGTPATAVVDAAALRQDLLPFELLAAATGRLPPPELPRSADFARQASALAEWQASITPEEQELAALADCPFTSCRRAWAR